MKVDILKEQKNITCTELEKVPDIQGLEFGSTRTENVNRVIKEISKTKHLEIEGVSLSKEFRQLLWS